MKLLIYCTDKTDGQSNEPIHELMNEPIGDSGDLWEGDVTNGEKSDADDDTPETEEPIAQPLRDSEIETLYRNYKKANTTAAIVQVLKKANMLLKKPHTTTQADELSGLISDITSNL